MEFSQKEDGQDNNKKEKKKKHGVNEGLQLHNSSTQANILQLNLVRVLALYSFPEIVEKVNSNDLLFRTLQFVMLLNYATCFYCLVQQKTSNVFMNEGSSLRQSVLA